MITAVDTNIFLDLLIPNARFVDSSKEKLEKAHGEGELIVCEVVWAELASQFVEQPALEAFLRDAGIRRVPATEDALFAADRRRGRRGQGGNDGSGTSNYGPSGRLGLRRRGRLGLAWNPRDGYFRKTSFYSFGLIPLTG